MVRIFAKGKRSICSARKGFSGSAAIALPKASAIFSRSCAAAALVKVGVLQPADRDRIVNVLEKLGFDLMPPVDVKRLLKEVGKDKKSEDGMLRIVLPVGIGDCEVRPMPIADFAALFA